MPRAMATVGRKAFSSLRVRLSLFTPFRLPLPLKRLAMREGISKIRMQQQALGLSRSVNAMFRPKI